MSASNRFRIKDDRLGVTLQAIVTRTKKREFFLIVSREPKDERSMSPPLRLAAQSWEEAMGPALHDPRIDTIWTRF